MVKTFYTYAVLLAITFATQASTAPDDLPFEPGERLTYSLRWGAIPAGTVVFEVRQGPEDNYHIVMTAKTNKVVSAIYKVRDRIDAYVDPLFTRSTGYRKKQEEGRRKREVTIAFDWPNRKAQYHRVGSVRPPVDLIPGAFDPLSAFYAFRAQCTDGFTEIALPVTDGKRCITGRLTAIGEDRVRVPYGNVDAVKTESKMDEVGGVFAKSDDARLVIWLSKGDWVPVKFASKVAVGYFTGELVAKENTLAANELNLPSAVGLAQLAR